MVKIRAYVKSYRVLCLAVVPTLLALCSKVNAGANQSNQSTARQKITNLRRHNRPQPQRSESGNIFEHESSTYEDSGTDTTTSSVDVGEPVGDVNAIIADETINHNIETRQSSTNITTPTVCALNENGFFGEPVGAFYEIGYLYQTTVTAGTTSIVIVNDITPALDREITESVLPYLFSSQCTINNGAQRKRQRVLESSDIITGTINAISSLPEDQFLLTGISCRGVIIPGGDCYIVEGTLTILGNSFISIGDVESIVLPAIQYGIQNLEPSLDNILQVQFLTDDLQTTSPVTAPPVPAPTDPQPSTPETIPPSSGTTPASSDAPLDTNDPTNVPTANNLTFAPVVAPSAITFAPIGITPIALTPQPSPISSLAPTRSSSIVSTGTKEPETSSIPTPSVSEEEITFQPSQSSSDSGTTLPPVDSTGSPVSSPDTKSSEGGPDWWIFLVIGLLVSWVLLCAYMYSSMKKNQFHAPPPDQKFAEINVRKNNPEEAYEPPSSNNIDNTAYEPPSSRGDEYVPPGMGFNIVPPMPPIIPMDDVNAADDEDDEDDEEEEGVPQVEEGDGEEEEEEEEEEDEEVFEEEEPDNTQQFFHDDIVLDSAEDGDVENEQDEFGDEEDMEEVEEVEEGEETYHEEDDEVEGEEIVEIADVDDQLDDDHDQEEEYDEEGEEGEEGEYFDGDEQDGGEEEGEEFEDDEYYDEEQYEVNENEAGWGNQQNAFDNNF